MKAVGLKLFTFSLYLVPITIVLNRGANNFAIALLILSWIASYPWESKNLQKTQISPVGWSAILLLISYALSFFWTENFDSGVKVIEVLAPFLIFPLVLMVIPNEPNFKVKLIKTFIYSTIFILILVFIIAILRTNDYGLYYKDLKQTVVYNNFFYHGIASGIGIHPSFLSLFCAFGIIALINLDRLQLDLSKLYRIIAIVILVAGMILLQAVMIALATAATIFLLYLLKSFRYRIRLGFSLLFVVLFLTAVAIIFVMKFDISKNLIAYDLEAWEGWNSINLRLALWDASLKAIYESPVWGFGIGDAQDVLLATYQQSFPFAAYNNYQPHNQLIMTWLMAGIPGLLLTTVFFITLFRSGFKQLNYLYLGMVLILLLFSITDIPLLRNKPLVFFMFFVALFENRASKE